MIRVTVMVVGEKRSTHRGRIDPGGTFDSVKADIVRAFMLGDPQEFTIALAPRDEKRRLIGSYELQDEDTIILISAEITRGPSFVPDDSVE